MFPSLRGPRASALFGLSTFAALAIFAGCNKNAVTPSAGGAAAPSNILATGQRVFQANGCARCHAVNGQGGQRGPDLSHVGTDPRHTPQWLAAYVKNPQQVDHGSRMPAFGDRIKAGDLTALSTYLAGLK